MISTTEKNILSVSQLNRRAKQLLETHLPLIWVSGEISNLAMPASGHWYFSLKDQQAQVRCAMFRNANNRLKWTPESGQQVLLRARVSLYEGRGEYQLIVEHMDIAGAGVLQQQYEALKAKLEQEGLFDADRKQELPLFPKHIGLITSPTGAAVHDILSILERRYPIAPVTIFPTSVQGETAAQEMISALELAQQSDRCDVLIIGRGGGSIEDLWSFNDEGLVRAISACELPIISAVGHEVDFTLADFVADERAPTPSASAEIICPDISEWMLWLDDCLERLEASIDSTFIQKQRQLTALSQRIRHPGERIANQQQQLDHLRQMLVLATEQKTTKAEQTFQQLKLRLQQNHPEYQLSKYQQTLQNLQEKLHKTIEIFTANKQQQLQHNAKMLNAVSPLAILDRGYSLSSSTDGKLIKSCNDVDIDDQIITKTSHGSIISVVKNLLKEKD